MTTVYLVRHAVAAEREDWDGSEESRPLTDEGTDRMRDAAAGLSRMGVKVEMIFTSPLTRARQTADILAAALNLAKPKVIDCLAPGVSPVEACAAILDSACDAVMLVGHEPDMGHLASYFFGTARPMPFKKGACMAIGFEGRAGQGKGRLVWHMPTKVMKHL